MLRHALRLSRLARSLRPQQLSVRWHSPPTTPLPQPPSPARCRGAAASRAFVTSAEVSDGERAAAAAELAAFAAAQHSDVALADGDNNDEYEEEEAYDESRAWVIDTPRGPRTLVVQDGVILEPSVAASLRSGDASKIVAAEFVKSSVRVEDCPPPKHPEFAFIGRSNVGKSSLVNCLTGRKALASVSKTPGKTQTINHFRVTSGNAGPWYLVDLPGYGFARAPGELAKNWSEFTMEYFLKRSSLVSVLLLVDGTLPPQAVDLEVASWLGDHDVPFSVVFTKVDKRKKVRPGERVNPAANAKLFLGALAADWAELPPCVLTSSSTGVGRAPLLAHIAALRAAHKATARGRAAADGTKPGVPGRGAAAAAAARAKAAAEDDVPPGALSIAPPPRTAAVAEESPRGGGGGGGGGGRPSWVEPPSEDDVAPPRGSAFLQHACAPYPRHIA